MVFTMIGGGAHRLLATSRSALKEGVFRNGGELRYYDLDTSRSQAMAEMVRKSPEYRANSAPVAVKWDLTLEQALDGADLVSVTLLAGGAYAMNLSSELGWSYGFLGSDNVSYPGAFLALRGAPILMNVARTMERVCPNAVLLDFANPVAVLSAMVNRYTKIRCYGICEGHNNHGYDLTRLLTGEDVYRPDYDVLVAGVNHASFIVKGSYRGDDLFTLIRQRLSDCPDWLDRLQFSPYVSDITRQWMRFGLSSLATLFTDRGALMFSTEADGFQHYFHDEALRFHGSVYGHDGELLDTSAMETLKAANDASRKERLEANRQFDLWAKSPADEIPWNDPARHIFHVTPRGDVQVKTLLGLSGVEKTRVAVSALNDGSVENMAKGLTLEFSHEVDENGLHPIGGLSVPLGVYGMTASLAAHQTLLADACATSDPRDLYRALLAYPIRSDSREAKELWGKLLTASRGTIAPSFEGLRALL
ncbi:MAG: hypothetical protein ACOXZM_01730 [Eubacteriales bacterium]|jgi:alpha-galactosidase/6-phospho-beta-glucosidase family protein